MFYAYRRKIIFVGIVLALFSVSFLGFKFFNSQDQQDFSANILKASEIIAQKFDIRSYIVEDEDTWSVITEKVGLGGSQGALVFDSTYNVYDLASIRSGNEFRFFFNKEDQTLARIEYDIDDTYFLFIKSNEQGEYIAEKREIHYEIKEVIGRGIIENSLFETAQEQGIPPNVILNTAHILSWDIDFASSVQVGDSFAILYETRSRNGIPAKPGKILAASFTNSGKDFYAFRYTNYEGHSDHYNMEGRELRRQFLKSPLDYTRITSGFSYNRFHPILQTFTTHKAIDYAASTGTPISVTGDGVVTYAGWKSGYGNFVQVRHGGGYSTAYAHLSAYGKGIGYGVKVQQNDIIGFVGSTGLSTGPHLHYEMLYDGIKINPLSVDLPPGKVMEGEYLEDFYIVRDKLLERID